MSAITPPPFCLTEDQFAELQDDVRTRSSTFIRLHQGTQSDEVSALISIAAMAVFEWMQACGAFGDTQVNAAGSLFAMHILRCHKAWLEKHGKQN